MFGKLLLLVAVIRSVESLSVILLCHLALISQDVCVLFYIALSYC